MDVLGSRMLIVRIDQYAVRYNETQRRSPGLPIRGAYAIGGILRSPHCCNFCTALAVRWTYTWQNNSAHYAMWTYLKTVTKITAGTSVLPFPPLLNVIQWT
jgi:hypothetical protein